LRRFLRDTLDYIDGAFIQEVAHLLGHFSPSSSWIVVEKEANDCQEQENERSEREHSVVGECSSQPRYFISEPFRKCLFNRLNKLPITDERFPDIVIPPLSNFAGGSRQRCEKNTSDYSFFFSGSTFGKSCLFSLNVPVKALMNALRKTLKIVVMTAAFGSSKLPLKGTLVPNRSLG